MCNCFRRNRHFHFLDLTLPKNRFRVGNWVNECRNKNQHPRDTKRADFQPKWTNLIFLAHICPHMDLGFKIQKTNCGTRISIVEIPWVPMFRENGKLWLFLAQIRSSCVRNASHASSLLIQFLQEKSLFRGNFINIKFKNHGLWLRASFSWI